MQKIYITCITCILHIIIWSYTTFCFIIKKKSIHEIIQYDIVIIIDLRISKIKVGSNSKPIENIHIYNSKNYIVI